MIRLVKEKEIHSNSRVYICINNRMDINLKGQYLLKQKFGVLNRAFEIAIKQHYDDYPDEPINEIKLVYGQTEEGIEI